MSINKAITCIKDNSSFLITTHTSPEGDALGSELAFYLLLKKLGKKAMIVNADAVPINYAFLPQVEKIKSRKNSEGFKFDCFAILDCSDMKRCGEVSRVDLAGKTVLNIDHHISNEKFGGVNWVEPYASSASEMVYKLYKKMRVPFDKDAALCIYVGIATDTGYFRYVNTNAVSHQAAAEFLKFGLDIRQIYKNIYENIPFEDMRLLSRILLNINRSADGKVIWFQVERQMLKAKNLSFDLTDEILSFARAIKDVEVAALFRENLGAKDEVRVNFRSQGKVDVNKIAQCFGGGGHKTASGVTVKGKIDDIRRKVLAKIKEAIVRGQN